MKDSGAIWTNDAEQFMALQHFSQERALHPRLIGLIESTSGSKLLDYGCGDGRILQRFTDRWSIDAYDPSPQMRRLVQNRAGTRLNRLFQSSLDISEVYDVVLLGMVILCIPDEAEVLRVLRDCARVMHKKSQLFVTTTHPCFRPWRFSNITTSFGRDQPFTYMENGKPFEVTIRDSSTVECSFTDYHWPLSFTIDALRSSNLSLVSLIEVPDDPESLERNSLVPPFLILNCRRNS